MIELPPHRIEGLLTTIDSKMAQLLGELHERPSNTGQTTNLSMPLLMASCGLLSDLTSRPTHLTEILQKDPAGDGAVGTAGACMGGF
jgi:hypothetical protein